MSIDELPQEIIFLIISYLDNASLLSVIKTARFLRPQAEYALYRRVDIHEGQMSQTRTIDFLIAVVRNPRLGNLVYSFHPHNVNYHMALASTGEFVEILAYGTKFLRNLKTLMLRRLHGGIPQYLHWNFFQIPPFQLQRLLLRFRYTGIQNASTLCRDLLQLLQCHPRLRHLCLYLPVEPSWGDAKLFSKAFWPSLEVLEGTDAVIPLLLPKGRVKSLLWDCDRPQQTSLRSARDLDTDPCLRNTFFTPELCEAYSRLENLVIYDQITLLPILSKFLSTLKTLLLSVWVPSSRDDQLSSQWDERLFMGAIREMRNLEVLAVTWLRDSDVGLDHKAVFVASRSLKYFSFVVNGDCQILQSPVYMGRGANGDVYPVLRDAILDTSYLHRGWFTFDTEDENL